MEGYWLNIETLRHYPIREHAQWLSDPDNMAKIGLKPWARKRIAALDPVSDREEIVLIGMKAGLLRIRSHGDYVAFEHMTNQETAINAIKIFLKKEQLVGPSGMIIINDLLKKKHFEGSLADLLADRLEEGKMMHRSPKLVERIEKRLSKIT